MKYSIVDGSNKMNVDEVIRLLRMTYWADQRPVEQIEKSMQNSSCYGVRLEDDKKLRICMRVECGVWSYSKPRTNRV